MPFKILFNLLLAFLSFLFAKPPQPDVRDRGFNPDDDDYEDLEPADYKDRSAGNFFDKFVGFVKKINPFRQIALVTLVRTFPKSEAELTDRSRIEIIEYIAARIPDPQDAQEVLSNIFELMNTAKKLAIGLGIKKHEPAYV